MKEGELVPDSVNEWCPAIGRTEQRELDGEKHTACVVEKTEIFVIPKNSTDMVVVSGDGRIHDHMNDPDRYKVQEDEVQLLDEAGHDEVTILR